MVNKNTSLDFLSIRIQHLISWTSEEESFLMNQVRLHLRRRKEDIVRTRSGRRKANMEIGRRKFQM